MKKANAALIANYNEMIESLLDVISLVDGAGGIRGICAVSIERRKPRKNSKAWCWRLGYSGVNAPTATSSLWYRSPLEAFTALRNDLLARVARREEKIRSFDADTALAKKKLAKVVLK